MTDIQLRRLIIALKTMSHAKDLKMLRKIWGKWVKQYWKMGSYFERH